MLRATVADALSALEQHAPSGTAEEWDQVGLLVGDTNWPTEGAIVSIDLTEEAILAAQKKGYRLIINHHPCIFPKGRGLSRVTAQGSGTEPLVFEAIRQGIAIASCHTNFDQSALEVVSAISEGLGVQALGRLHEQREPGLLKLVTFVPESHLEAVKSAIFKAGAGVLGNYDSCSFNSVGEGTYRGNEGTRPFLGRPGKLEVAQERRLETVLPQGLRKPVLNALLKSHPYEEVAYDFLRVEQDAPSLGLVSGLGYGFWGEFSRPKSFSDVAQGVKTLFNLDGFWVTEPTPARIRRIAFAAGKGASFVRAAAQAKCDLMITGEAGYHTALDGSRRGMTVMELGHRESEKFFVPTVRKWLTQASIRSLGVDVVTQKIWLGGKK